MITFTDLRAGLIRLGLSHTPVIAHVSAAATDEVLGGAEALFRSVVDSVWVLIMPAFTYQTMITPEVGPPDNAILYGSQGTVVAAPEPFTTNMPVHRNMGLVAETLRLHPRARRTSHPILSFAGISAEKYLAAQTLAEPLGVVGALADADGWVLLIGADHTSNVSIHYAERMAGRKQFTRWALLPDRVVECPGFPGDSAGFEELTSDLAQDTRQVSIGNTTVQAMPVRGVIQAATASLRRDPTSLLCSAAGCACCNAVREALGGAATAASDPKPDSGSSSE